MPFYDSTLPSEFQVYISTYTMDSFMSSLLEVHNIAFWVRSSMVPPTAPMSLTTTSLKTFLPGIESYYGADVPVDLHIKVETFGDITSSQSKQQLGGISTLTIEFWVETASGEELATSMTLSNTSLAFTLLVSADMALTLNIDTVNVDKVVVNYCSFGKLNALTLKVELNNFFRLFTPILNLKLAQHPIELPTNFFIFTLSDVVIGYFDSYVYFGFTPTFVSPPFGTDGLPRPQAVERFLSM